MKIVVIGLGSMGKRRIRLILELFPKEVIFGVDMRIERQKEAEELFGINCFFSLDDVELDHACAFVCTHPNTHAEIIRACLLRGWHVFSELNLVDRGYDENILLAKEANCVLFLSSTFLYREEIKYIQNFVTSEEKWNYIYHVGQYLPNWHPWESIKDFFAGEKQTNGCREIMAIELPWLTRTFGLVQDVHSVSDKLTKLDIEFNDNYLIQVSHENGNKGLFLVDVVSPYAIRKLEIYAEKRYLSWEGTPESLKVYDLDEKSLINAKLEEKTEHQEGYSSFVVENAYRNEIREFFKVIETGKTPIYDFEQDKVTLKLIDKIGA